MRIKHSEPGFDETILRYMSVHVGRSYSARELAKKIQIKKRDFKVFRRILRNLAKQGILWESEEGIFQLPDSKKAFRDKKKQRQKPEHAPEKNRQGEELVEGTLKQYRGGFAFLIAKDREKEDVFIPPDGLGGAIEGDHVQVRIVRPQGQKKAEGQVVKIVDRRIQTIVGVFQTGKAYGKVIPWDRKLHIEPTISTKNFAGATDGMMVEAELIPDTNPPEAKIVSLLGFQGEPDLDTKIIVSRYHLPREFPKAVLEEAEKVAVINEEDYKGRKDFRDWWTVTIDGQKARDFDDAISITAFKNGGFLLGVHIADVANYVKEDSALDVEARERGNSVYFPELGNSDASRKTFKRNLQPESASRQTHNVGGCKNR